VTRQKAPGPMFLSHSAFVVHEGMVPQVKFSRQRLFPSTSLLQKQSLPD
jgi:hypothetical protein